MTIYISVCLSKLTIFLLLCLPTCPSVYLPTCLHIHRFIFLAVYLPTRRPAYLSTFNLSTYLHIFLSTCLSVYFLFFYLSNCSLFTNQHIHLSICHLCINISTCLWINNNDSDHEISICLPFFLQLRNRRACLRKNVITLRQCYSNHSNRMFLSR